MTNKTFNCAQGRTRFTFDVRLGIIPAPVDVALVLLDATQGRQSLDSELKLAREAAPLAFIIQTKIDLIPRDYSAEHLSYLEKQPSYRYFSNTECLNISVLTGEGVNDLLAYIANAVDPTPEHQTLLRAFPSRIGSKILDLVASVFALPTRDVYANVDAELATVATHADISRLRKTEMATSWQVNLRQRVNATDSNYSSLCRLTQSLIVKYWNGTEVANMEFVRQNTTIPIPRVHHPHLGHLVMDYVDGDMLYEFWDKLSTFMQFRIACTMRVYIKQLRALRHSTVGAMDTGHVAGLLFESHTYGPFSNPDHFQRFCEYVAFIGWKTRTMLDVSRGRTIIPLPHPKFDWTPVFTHGDLNSSNILLDKKGCLWIIDWATAGYYPSCLESQCMRLVDELASPRDELLSWRRYRHFITGRTSKEEDIFWQAFLAAIHRFPGITI